MHPSTNGMMSSRLGTITVPVRYASGAGSGWKPILVTTPKFLPEQAIYVSAHAVAYPAHVFAFGRAPIPVRTISPLGRTTSMPRFPFSQAKPDLVHDRQTHGAYLLETDG